MGVFCMIGLSFSSYSTPRFVISTPQASSHYEIDATALCATAQQTLAYLDKGMTYDPTVIHEGHALPIPLSRVKATLRFICQNPSKMNDPVFVQRHFEFIRWQPDLEKARQFALNKPLLSHLPTDRILMTKYYVHLAGASRVSTGEKPYALYALPSDERALTLEQANKTPHLTRFQYGKQAILAGALNGKAVSSLAYVNRDDLESALMQGTLVADFGDERTTLNVHRNNNIEYDRLKAPYAQERYWYFKAVDGIKGYGRDADHKITVNTGVTFAADLAQLGLGKLLMVQYPNAAGEMTTHAGILADTGGAFVDNLYQVDFLSGVYRGKNAYRQATRALPDYVYAYFMVVK